MFWQCFYFNNKLIKPKDISSTKTPIAKNLMLWLVNADRALGQLDRQTQITTLTG